MWGYAAPFYLASALMVGTLGLALAVRMDRAQRSDETLPST